MVDRLRDGERLRIESRDAAFELTSDELCLVLEGAVSTPSYLTGTTSMPGGCYYTWSRGAPPAMERFRVGRGQPTSELKARQGLHRDIEELLIEADILTIDAEGITRLDGRLAPVRTHTVDRR